MKKIFLVTVVYNAVDTLEFTIQSVIRFKSSCFKYIIIDGGSTDGTLNILEKYKKEIYILVTEPDNGIYDAMNKSLSYLGDGWVLFLGADDILLESPEKIYTYLKEGNTIYYFNSFFNILQSSYDGKFNSYKLSRKNICHQAILYPSSVFKIYKYELKYNLLADYYLNLLLWTDKRFKFQYVPLTISVFNQYGSCGQNIDINFLEDKHKVLKDNFSFFIYASNVFLDFFKDILRKPLNRIRKLVNR